MTVDISELSTTPVRGNPNQHRVDHGHKKLPFDLPIQLSVNRLTETNKDGIQTTLTLGGWELLLECITVPAKVTHRITRNPSRLEILVNGEVVYAVEGEPSSVIHLAGEPADDPVFEEEPGADDDSWMDEV